MGIKMTIARGSLDSDQPYVYEADVPPDTFRLFKSDRAWTRVSFGERCLTVAIPGDDKPQVTLEWATVKRMILNSPNLFDAMIREPKKKTYVPD